MTKPGSQFQKGKQIIECLSPKIDGPKGHLFGFFRHLRGCALPTFFSIRLGTMRKHGWMRVPAKQHYVPKDSYLPDLA